MPSIRLLCTALNAPTAPPHIFAGVSSVLTLSPPIPPTSPARNSTNTKLPALIIAIALIVYTRLSGTATPAREYARQKSLGLAVLAESTPKDVAQNEPVDVDAWFREIRDRGWTQCDWFANVPEGAGLGVSSSAGEANNSTNEETETQEPSIITHKDIDLNPTVDVDDQSFLLPGLGTMVFIPIFPKPPLRFSFSHSPFYLTSPTPLKLPVLYSKQPKLTDATPSRFSQPFTTT